MRRLTSTILLICGLLLGSGALEFLHNAQHEAEDARTLAAARRTGDPDPSDLPPVHDDSNCATHLQLHLPALAAGWTPLLVLLGLFVAFLTMLAPAFVSRRPVSRRTCRGPPVA